MLGPYSKLVGALLGNVIAMVIVWLGTKGFATCTGVGDANTCTILGFSTAQITAGTMMLVNSLFVYAFPRNRPNA